MYIIEEIATRDITASICYSIHLIIVRLNRALCARLLASYYSNSNTSTADICLYTQAERRNRVEPLNRMTSEIVNKTGNANVI